MNDCDINMTYCDPPSAYDMNLVLQLLCSCLCNEDTTFCAKLLHEHNFNIPLGTVDVFRAGFIWHIYNGNCVSHQGISRKAVVLSECWPQSMGIQLIDSRLQWMEQGALTAKELASIYGAIETQSQSLCSGKSLMAKMVNCCHHLIVTTDTAALSIPELFPHLGCSSTEKKLTLIADAHCIETLNEDSQIQQTGKIIEHLTRGLRAQQTDNSLECDRVANDYSLRCRDAIHLQVAVLWHVIEAATKKQLIHVLDLHEIPYEAMDKQKKLRDQLKKFVLHIERGKLKQLELEQEVIERLRKLDDIRRVSWTW